MFELKKNHCKELNVLAKECLFSQKTIWTFATCVCESESVITAFVRVVWNLYQPEEKFQVHDMSSPQVSGFCMCVESVNVWLKCSSEAEYWTAAPPILSLYALIITDKKEAINLQHGI